MRENRSFIFFRETTLAEDDGPIGAAGVPLTAVPQPRRRPHAAYVSHAGLGRSAGLADPEQQARRSAG